MVAALSKAGTVAFPGDKQTRRYPTEKKHPFQSRRGVALDADELYCYC
jgi:hypothetical protein